MIGGREGVQVGLAEEVLLGRPQVRIASFSALGCTMQCGPLFWLPRTWNWGCSLVVLLLWG